MTSMSGSLLVRLRGWFWLVAASSLIAAIWGVALPEMARNDFGRARRELLEHHNVNPDALFYTDLQAMPDIERRIHEARRKDPQAFF